MAEEESKVPTMEELLEGLGYSRALISSLEKEIREKDVEMGKLKSYVQELEEERKAVGGDLKELKKNVYVKELLEKITELKKEVTRLNKDNNELIYKLNKKDVLQKP